MKLTLQSSRCATARRSVFLCWVGCLLAVLLCASAGWAQQAGMKDLSVVDSRVPADHVPGPSIGSCPTVKTNITRGLRKPDENSDPGKDPVTLTIESASPLHIGGDFTATVRLKNQGATALQIPWEADGERVTRISASGQEESYEAADIALILKSADGKQKIVWLDAGGVLFAHPELKSSYLELSPGQWADIKVKGKLTCTQEDLPCSKIVPDPHGLLSAWWYQRELTHQVHDCNDDHGNTVIREMNSKELPVVVHAAAAAPQRPHE